jgi:formylglycine-generating enzyme required for sulfatase activity
MSIWWTAALLPLVLATSPALAQATTAPFAGKAAKASVAATMPSAKRPAVRPDATPAASAAAEERACRREILRLPEGITAFRDCVAAPEMLMLHGGSFRMGDWQGDGQSYERPVREVTVAPFALARTETTQASWRACVRAQACDGAALGDEAHARYPVSSINWEHARNYAAWLASRTGRPYRLPSEAEWEYSARAGEESRYTWGNSDSGCKFANFADRSGISAHPEWHWAEDCDDGFSDAAPVGIYKPNPWGFHDLLGNVWEWVADCWVAGYEGAPSDARAREAENCRKRVNRGGGFGNNLRSLRLSARDGDPVDAHSDGLGFRVALSLSRAPEAVVAVDTRVYDNRYRPAQPQQELPPPKLSLALERELILRIESSGKQSWVNGIQHTEGSTRQDYFVRTRLRSDGVLYGDNLLDADPERRLANKTAYLGRRGLIRLKQARGGRLPVNAAEMAAFANEVEAGLDRCMADPACINEVVDRLAALELLRQRTLTELEQLIATPATGAAARWLYFFGYANCPSETRQLLQTEIAGERAYDNKRKKLVPWSLRQRADGVAEDDRSGLCQRYTATVDVRDGQVWLENPYLPSPHGITLRRINKREERIEGEIVPLRELMTWLIGILGRGGERSTLRETLALTAPLDQDYTVLGEFRGTLDVHLSYSFLPVPGAAEARVPMH